MSTRIELEGAEGVHAGIQFTEGVATVDALGASKAAYFEAAGASITDEDADAAVATLRVGDKLLTDCTATELRELAATEGIDIPSKATKKDILHAFLLAFADET